MHILIAKHFGIQFDEALDISRDDVAWEYGGMIDNTAGFMKPDPYMQLLDCRNNISINGNCIV